MKNKIKSMTNNEALGEWIKQGLKEIGENQNWLAEKAGIQPPQMSRIINGQSTATPEILMKIATALGKRRSEAFRIAGYIERLTKEEQEKERLTHEDEQLMNEYEQLSPDDRRKALEFLKMLNRIFPPKKK